MCPTEILFKIFSFHHIGEVIKGKDTEKKVSFKSILKAYLSIIIAPPPSPVTTVNRGYRLNHEYSFRFMYY